jgi:hypothetical protein
MTQRESEQRPRFCPNCGAPTVPGISHCGTCGQSLLPPEEHNRLWSRNAQKPPHDDSEIIDLYPADDLSSQATTPFTQTRPFEPDARPATAATLSHAEQTVAPWSSGSGKLARGGATVPAPAGAAASVSSSTERERSGPPGCVLGCIGLLLIAVIGALLAWGAIRSAISDQIDDEIGVGITNELRTIDQIPVASSGRLRITEAEINTALERNAELYKPIQNVRVNIDSDAVAIAFSLYGFDSTFTTDATVENGRFVLIDPSLSGPAGQFIDEDAIAALFEAEVAALLQRSNLNATEVSLRDGSIVIATQPAG